LKSLCIKSRSTSPQPAVKTNFFSPQPLVAISLIFLSLITILTASPANADTGSQCKGYQNDYRVLILNQIVQEKGRQLEAFARAIYDSEVMFLEKVAESFLSDTRTDILEDTDYDKTLALLETIGARSKVEVVQTDKINSIDTTIGVGFEDGFGLQGPVPVLIMDIQFRKAALLGIQSPTGQLTITLYYELPSLMNQFKSGLSKMVRVCTDPNVARCALQAVSIESMIETKVNQTHPECLSANVVLKKWGLRRLGCK
jgi:hypothetical protein